MNGFLKNPFTVLYVLGITLFFSIWTILDVSIRTVSRKTFDKRLRLWAKMLVNNAKLDYSVHNPHNVKIDNTRPYILMCNHSSHYDIPLSLLAIEGSIRMLAKRELMEIPIWGRGMRLAEFVALDRKNPRQAIKDMRYAKTLMKQGIVLWIAPEGTRSKTGKLQKFKTGGFKLAMEAGAIIIPIGIVGSGEVMAAKSLQINKGKHVEVHIGKAVDSSEYPRKDRKELIRNVESQIRYMTGQAN